MNKLLCNFYLIQNKLGNLGTNKFYSRDFVLDKSLKDMVDKEMEQLETNPYVGKPLGYRFFREKRVKNYRLYYLIYDEHVVVFVIAISDKKGQQRAIDTIRNQIPYYKKEIKKRLNL